MPTRKGSPARPRAKAARPDDVLARLGAALPEPRCELAYADAWQLLVATILSAQSTDKMVNQVTPPLFARWPTPRALGEASQEAVELAVKRTGFFRNKARAIREASRRIAEELGGEVPRDLETLVTLPGVARKTANVVLGTAYGIASGFTVDTHAGRVARRLGLSTAEDPVKVELDLCAAFPRETWIAMGHRFVLHGRYVCLAKRPRCAGCPLAELCPAAEATPVGDWRVRAAAEGALVEGGGAALATAPPKRS